ncbi:glycoside hydrolase superfamily [Radiomyces spectabilis]|uniref:glycoside hydrolase superfamily n=1 Tax=Radiomyces spectabilis TaxID=64574 RepID=UPI0022212886|nr:glycoside hydrolase superfamily [Radiomyces spectabilis]KAI8376252.1 glycoside hydrolase superfamily [Radiomyces spectabilis]
MWNFILLLCAFTPLALAALPFYGLNYGMNTVNCPSLEDVKRDFQALKPYTNRVRIFTLVACQQGDLVLRATQELGMRAYLGMWVSGDPNVYEKELEALKSLVNTHDLSNVDGIIVGSEALYRNETTPQQMVNYISRTQELVHPKKIPVATADVYYKFPPEVVKQIDFLMMNAFPYWEGVTVDQGATKLIEHYDSLVSEAQGKQVRISETGWPTSGPNFGESVPSPQNQATYLRDVLEKVRARNIDMIWFAAIDEPYKGGIESAWGILDANRHLKPDLKPILS